MFKWTKKTPTTNQLSNKFKYHLFRDINLTHHTPNYTLIKNNLFFTKKKTLKSHKTQCNKKNVTCFCEFYYLQVYKFTLRIENCKQKRIPDPPKSMIFFCRFIWEAIFLLLNRKSADLIFMLNYFHLFIKFTYQYTLLYFISLNVCWTGW